MKRFALLLVLLFAQTALPQEQIVSSSLGPWRGEAALRQEGFTQRADGVWVKPVTNTPAAEMVPLPGTQYMTGRFRGNPRFPIQMGGNCATGNCGTGVGTSGSCPDGNCPLPSSGTPSPVPPVVGVERPDPVTPAPATGSAACGDCKDVVAAVQANAATLQQLQEQLAGKAEQAAVVAAIDKLVENQTKLLSALEAMAGSMGEGGPIGEIAIQVQRNTQQLSSMNKQLELLNGHQQAFAAMVTEVQAKLQDQAVSIQSVGNQVAAVNGAVADLARNQDAFDSKLSALTLKIQNIEKGQFRFRMKIDPATGKVVSMEPVNETK